MKKYKVLIYLNLVNIKETHSQDIEMKNSQKSSFRKYVGIVFGNIMGNEIYPLTKNFPISTLPVGHKKLIVYQLQQLETVTDLSTIIVLYSQQSIKVKQYLENQFMPHHPQYPHSILFFEVQDNKSEYLCLQSLLGSPICDGFDEAKGLIVLPPDIISSIKLNTLLNQHIDKQADISMLLKQKKQYGKDQKKPDYQFQPQVDIALVNSNGQLLALKLIELYEFDGFNLNASVYKRISRASFKKVIDSRFYIFGPRIIKIIKNLVSQELNQLKIDFIDTVIRNQINCTLLDYTGQKNYKPLKIISKIVQQNEYIRRISSVKIYQNTNLDSLIRGQKQKQVLIPNHYTEQLDQKGMSDYKGSLIGKGSQIEPGTKLTRSIVEKGCKIGKNVQIINSIIMSGSTIQDGCKINNSVVCPNCQIRSQSTVINCQIALNSVVQKGSNFQNSQIIPN